MAADPISATPPPSAGPALPLDVELRLSRPALRATFTYVRSADPVPAPDPGTEIEVGNQARAAYEAAIRRMFRGGEARAELEIERVTADLDSDVEGWHAVVEHALVLRSSGAGEMGRWMVKGRERIVGLGPRAMPAAFQRAAAQAARRFEAAFDEPAGVSEWLRGRRIGYVPRIADTSLAPPAAERTAPPRDYAFHLDFAGGVYLHRATSFFGKDLSPAGGLMLRGGFSGPWVFAEAMFARANAAVGGFESQISARGLQAGILLRIHDDVDLFAGFGVQYITYETSQFGDSRGSNSQAFLAGLRFAKVMTPAGARVRLGLDVRSDFGERAVLGAPNFGTSVQIVPAFSAWLVVGLESAPMGDASGADEAPQPPGESAPAPAP